MGQRLQATATLAADHWGKIAVGIATPIAVWLLTGAFSWLQSNVVFASDLDKVAEKVTQSVSNQLSDIAKQNAALAIQTAMNTQSICISRKGELRSSIRTLTVQIEKMESDKKAKPAAWTQEQQQMLDRWQYDLDESQDDLKKLDC